MGTRADFYVGRGENAEWLGSIGFDGYPSNIGPEILAATSEEPFRESVRRRIADTKSGTTPDQGWPWPWDNGHLTDYSYAFDDGKVWMSNFGRSWLPATENEPDEWPGSKVAFPDMTAKKNVTLGPRSGLAVFTIPRG
jgi:hypothetical protein